MLQGQKLLLGDIQFRVWWAGSPWSFQGATDLELTVELRDGGYRGLRSRVPRLFRGQAGQQNKLQSPERAVQVTWLPSPGG